MSSRVKYTLLAAMVLSVSMCSEPATAEKTFKAPVKVSVSDLMGKFDPGKHPDFALIPSNIAIRQGMHLRKETITALEKLAKAARAAGFEFYVNSATRNFYSQKYIWEGKFNGRRKVGGQNLAKTVADKRERALIILKYSSMPGTSRHHWGTDMDIGYSRNSGAMFNNAAFESGTGKKFYDWMTENGPKYGFCQPYKGKPSQRRQGYQYGYEVEKWHWSYLPLAERYLNAYQELIIETGKTPAGFAGSEFAGDFYRHYVMNISSMCR